MHTRSHIHTVLSLNRIAMKTVAARAYVPAAFKIIIVFCCRAYIFLLLIYEIRRQEITPAEIVRLTLINTHSN